MADIEIEIDGRTLAAKPNQTVIQVADEAGIYIPRFCYHKHLTIPANCRMCLVEVEKVPKPLPACATPVAPGMKVFTKSPKTLAAQRSVMEFLLINHPLDCPICDQGGECELQDLSMGYGSDWSHYDEAKRAVADEDLGPLVATDMTRCIYCTRCVRFGDEIAGVRELGALGRSEFTEIGTYIQHAVKSEVSGNIIDLCPVGALTSKPYRFTARPWELDQWESISPHDCVGSRLHVHTRYGKVMRVVSAENPEINETWISDRDRFSYTGLCHADRLEEPLVRVDGRLQAADWSLALERAATGLQNVIAEFGADKIAGLASPSSTVEEFYLLQKIIRGLGSPHIDHRLRMCDPNVEPEAPIPLHELDQCDGILLIGSNIQKEQPVAGLRVRKANLRGATVAAINNIDYPFNFKLQAKTIVAPHRFVETLQALLDDVNKADEAIMQALSGKKNSYILLGAMALNHPEASKIQHLARQLAKQLSARVGLLTEGANSAGGLIAGAVPHLHAGGEAVNHVGLHAHALLDKPRKAYVLINVEPDLDLANAHCAIDAIKQAKFVVALSLYRNPILEAEADVVLPMAAFTETAGTFVNLAGHWQSVKGCANAFGQSRPGWKILRALGNFLELEGFNYEHPHEIIAELKQQIEQAVKMDRPRENQQQNGKTSHATLSRIGEIPLYAVDSLVRRAKPLQTMQTLNEGSSACVRMHSHTAKRLNVNEGTMLRVKQKGELELPVVIDDRIAVDALSIAGGIPATVALGNLFGDIEVLR